MQNEKDIDALLEDLFEQLAKIEHERWSHWQKYMHDQCQPQPNGDLVIPSKLVKQWDRQLSTPYGELTEREKESDRDQVRKYLPLIASEMRRNKLSS